MFIKRMAGNFTRRYNEKKQGSLLASNSFFPMSRSPSKFADGWGMKMNALTTKENEYDIVTS